MVYAFRIGPEFFLSLYNYSFLHMNKITRFSSFDDLKSSRTSPVSSESRSVSKREWKELFDTLQRLHVKNVSSKGDDHSNSSETWKQT
jgi:hypothetical protein